MHLSILKKFLHMRTFVRLLLRLIVSNFRHLHTSLCLELILINHHQSTSPYVHYGRLSLKLSVIIAFKRPLHRLVYINYAGRSCCECISFLSIPSVTPSFSSCPKTGVLQRGQQPCRSISQGLMHSK